MNYGKEEQQDHQDPERPFPRHQEREGKEGVMARYRAHFFDKNSDELRSFYVEAKNESFAEDEAEAEADRRGWPSNFRLNYVIPLTLNDKCND